MTTTLELINAIASGDAVATEDAFNASMAEKISARLDDLRVRVAQNMFNAVDQEEQTGTDEQE
jgi:hypothetical protein